jgi:hypothetical protein
VSATLLLYEIIRSDRSNWGASAAHIEFRMALDDATPIHNTFVKVSWHTDLLANDSKLSEHMDASDLSATGGLA